MTYQTDISQTTAFLQEIIKEQVNDKEQNWIEQQGKKLQNNFQLRSFYLAFSTAPRFINKKPLNLTEEQLVQADSIRKGFQPNHWNILQCVRAYLLLMLPVENNKNYEEILNRLFETADIDEQVTLYGLFPLLPYPKTMAKRAKEGLRTNITDVFDAIALDNPYPADFLVQDAWNQMILKAVFMQRPLYRIYGADDRANPELARMLIDFAHERWAAKRAVSPELWRFVGPFLNKNYSADIDKVIKGEPLEKKAGLLACASCEEPKAQKYLDQYPEVKKDIENSRFDWTLIGKEVENNSGT